MIGNRIKELRKEIGLSQSEFGEACGWDQARQSHYETGRRSIGLEEIITIAMYLDVDVSEIVDGGPATRIQKEKAHHNVSELPQVSFDVPVISWVQAGEWEQAVDNFYPGDSDEKLPRPAEGGVMVYGLVVRGDSMTAPLGAKMTFLEGERIYVDPEQRNPENGHFIIAKLKDSDEVTLKQYKIGDGGAYLQPLNPQWNPIFTEFSVLGRVIGKYQIF